MLHSDQISASGLIPPSGVRLVELVNGRPIFSRLRPSSYRQDVTKVTGEEVRSLPIALAVRPDIVGICRSDLKEMNGTRSSPDSFGHELVGRVVYAADGVALQVGERVCMNPNVAGISRTSGFADLIIAAGEPGSLRRAFPPVPESLPHRRAVFVEPIACAVHCVRAMLRHLAASEIDGDLAGKQVTIVGAGTFGALIGLLCQRLGAQVILFNRGTEKLAFWKEVGVFRENELRPITELPRDTCDVAVVATSMVSPDLISWCASTLRIGGLLQLFGGTTGGDVHPETGVDVDAVRRRELCVEADFAGKRIKMGGGHGATSDDFDEAISILATAGSTMPVERFIAGVVPISDLAATLEAMVRNEIAGRSLVVF